MRTLQITFFIIANIIFITQSGHDIHQLIWGSEASILDQFEPEKAKARSEKSVKVLLTEYRGVNDQIDALEKGKGAKEVEDIQQKQKGLYDKKTALNKEISERENMQRQFRDLWIFTGFGTALIILGGFLYRARSLWAGVAIIITGFGIFECWASPSFFSGADAEFHMLLVSKTFLSLFALVCLYTAWRLMNGDAAIAPDEKRA